MKNSSHTIPFTRPCPNPEDEHKHWQEIIAEHDQLMNALPEYLRVNAKRIRNLGPQKLPSLSKEYLEWDEAPMQRLYQRFPKNEIQRVDLVALYKEWEDPVLALVTTLVWGGIDTRTQQRLQGILAIPEKTLIAKMNGIRDLIREGNFHQAIHSCFKGGANQIPGIGMSYFTKVFFCIGEATPELALKPLIFDKWTINAFFALHGQEPGGNHLRRYFTFPSVESLRKNRRVSLKTNVGVQAEAYQLYIESVRRWTTVLIDVTPAKLEEFVFGTSLKRDRTPTNPRIEILAIIERLITP
jgi:hypothetical protein